MTSARETASDPLDVGPQRLQLHPELFGVAYPEERDADAEWIPDDEFCYVTDTEEEFSVLCPQRRIPCSVRQFRGLRILVLYPHGFLMAGVVCGIEDELRAREIPYSGASHFGTDLGYLAVRDCDLPAVISVLRAAGHSVVEPGVS